ncbi:MAG: hypothetical protein ACFFB0_20270 [Promethearchaeota archaeon]
MVDFKKDTWLYALISGILGIISVFTPAFSGATAMSDETVSYWLGGIVGYMSGEDGGWGGFYGGTLWYLGITLVSITLLLTYAINIWRGKEFKWDWLIYLLSGLGMFVFSILFWVYFNTDLTIGFASIGIFISGIIAIIAFVFEKFGDKIFGRGE